MRRERVRRVLILLGVTALAMSLAAVALAQDAVDGERVRGYVPPPKDLRLVDDHWTPYAPPIPPEGADVHVVQKGDTLWDLASTYYGDPYLWPIIWDSNRYITYSHWIYPGDPLVVPPKPGVVTDAGVVEEPLPEPEPIPAPVQRRVEREVPFQRRAEESSAEARPQRPALMPAVEEEELICSIQLYDRFDPTPISVAGREEVDRVLQAEGDILYLSAGQNLGVSPGTEYVVLRPQGEITHPETGETAAVFVRRLGLVRVIAVQAQTATAQVKLSCDAMRVGDDLVPYRELPIPMIERIPLADLASDYPGDINGTVVSLSDLEANIAGEGDSVGIDLGHGAGITTGDRILFYRPGEVPDGPRRVLAQGIVIATQSGGATVKIIESRTEVLLGDKADVL